MKRQVKIEFCKSCLKDNEIKPKKFRKAMGKMLEAVHPDDELEVELTSCLKLCPRRNLAFSLRIKSEGELRKSVRTIAREPSEEGMREEIESLLR